MTNLMPYRYARKPVARPDFDLWTDSFFRPFFQTEENGAFRVDVRDMGDHYLMEADMPGVKRDQVNISVEDGVLSISTEMDEEKKEEKENYVYNERRSGRFQRSFTLNNIDEDKISAEYADGVLKLTLPKVGETPKTSKKIEIR